MKTHILIILLLLLGLTVPGVAQQAAQAPQFSPISSANTKITGGILHDRTQKNIENLYKQINIDTLKEVFRHEHGRWYAEPEFTGHYLEAGIHVYETTGDQHILDNLQSLIDVIIENQPASGHLGTYSKDAEFDPTFSVWNQNFVLKGLLAFYEKTGYQPALNAAMKCGDYLADSYLNNKAPDIFYAVNNGIEHVTVLDEIAHLYKITGKQQYLDFADYMIDRLESSQTQIINMPNTLPHWMIIYTIGCKKGIEMFVLYRGLLNLYQATGRQEYLTAYKKYRDGLALNDIRITGNGTINEMWTYHRSKPLRLTNDIKPNENCVAMGWMQMNALMFGYDANATYFDEFEKSLYNHMIGSQALDGHDFSYYQGNLGHKVHSKDPGMYSCCRYRGMRILAHLPRYIYMVSNDAIAVNLYTSSETHTEINDTPIKITQQTRYPRDGRIKLQVVPEKNCRFTLMLRKPGWCDHAALKINGNYVDVEQKNEYFYIQRQWSTSGDRVELDLEMNLQYTEVHVIDNEPCATVTYGPIVMAIDSRYGTPIEATKIDTSATLSLVPLPETEWNPQIKVRASGAVNGVKQYITLVDYATAGSLNPGVDEFRLWAPILE